MITSQRNDFDTDQWYLWREILQKEFTKLDLQSAIEICTSSAFATVSNAIMEAYIKLHTFGVLLETKNKHLEEKCVSLETKVEDLKDQLNKKLDLSEKTFVGGNASNSHSSQNDLDTESDLFNCIRSLPLSDQLEENEVENAMSETPLNKRSSRETSPVVQKQMRSGKRKFRLSTKKKNRMDGDEFNISATQYTEPEWTFTDASPELKRETKNIAPIEESNICDTSFVGPSPAPVSKNRRINSIFDNKILSGIDCVSDQALSPLSVNILENCQIPRPAICEKKNNPHNISNDRTVIGQKNDSELKTKWELKKERNVSVNGSKKFRQTTLSTSLFKKSVDISTLDQYKGGIASESNTSCMTDPVDMELTNVNNSFTNKYEEKENQSEKDISLTLQTCCAQSEKNKENRQMPIEPFITSQETYFQPDPLPKTNEKPYNEPDTGFPEDYFRVDQTNEIVPNAEIATAFQETFFEPFIASTNKEIGKKSPLAEKPLVKNSFDYLPSPENSPKYKYRRDALRKKADRQKLPGQKCIKCNDFYPCDDQARKYSRHRDKYPLHANTPPGLWNPRFDDTDSSD